MKLVVTAIDLADDDFKMIQTIVVPDLIEVVWVGDKITTDIEYDIQAGLKISDEKIIEKIQEKPRFDLCEKKA